MTIKRDLLKRYDDLLEVNRNLESRLFRSELLNKALIKSIQSEDTEIFVYEGKMYKVTDIRLYKNNHSITTLNVELEEYRTPSISSNGLLSRITNTIDEITKKLPTILYGNKEDK